jgi:choline dehydrogenase-like flavoprotein
VVESGGETVTEEVGRLNEIDDATGRYTRATTGRYRGLGGSSSRWGGRLIPVSRHDTSARPYISSPAWPFPIEELSQYEEEIESLFQVSPGSYEDIPSEQEAEQRAFPKDDRSILPRWAKCPNFKNCNLATLLADELRTSDRMEIWLEATVCDFELDRDAGRLVGITARDFSGHVLRVRADRFVIAAGGIEATRLLLLLDEVSQNRAFERCEVLGKFFQDHLKAEVATISRRDPSVTNRLFGYRFVDGTRRDLHLELPAAVQERDRVASAFGYVAMDLADSPLSDLKKLAQGLQRREFDAKAVSRASRNIGLLTKTAWWRIVENRLFVPADVDLRLMVCVEQLPHAQNRIGLSAKRDRLGNRLARFEWTPTQSDEETFRSAIAAIRAFWAAAGFDRRCPLEWQPCAVDASQPVISRAEACAHPSGSTRMGVEPVGSVVGPDLHCHAVPNVAVVGASVFPTAGSANPTLTIMELAYWLADFCLRDRTPAGAPPVSLMSA